MKRNNNTEERRKDILAAALRVAARSHYLRVTRDAVAVEAGVSGPLVQHYLGPVKKMREVILREAVASENLAIVAQALGAGEPYVVRSASEALKDKIREGVFL